MERMEVMHDDRPQVEDFERVVRAMLVPGTVMKQRDGKNKRFEVNAEKPWIFDIYRGSEFIMRVYWKTANLIKADSRFEMTWSDPSGACNWMARKRTSTEG